MASESVVRRLFHSLLLVIAGTALFGFSAISAGQTANLTKAFSPTSITSGGTATLTFTLTNNPPNNPAQVVAFTDNLPAGLVVAATPNPQGTCAATTAVVNPGATSVQVTTATVPASTASAGTCTLAFDVTNVSGQTGACPNVAFTNAAANIAGITNLNNFVTSQCLTVNAVAGAQADLSIVKDDSVTTVVSGSSITYGIAVVNGGPAAADGAVLTDPVATGLTKTAVACAATANGAVCPVSTTIALMEAGGVVIPTLPAGGIVAFTVTATVNATTGTVSNTATVAAPAGTTDPTPGNNSATDTDTVQAAAAAPSLNKAFSPTTILPGGTTTLTFTLTNPAGNNPAQVVGFTDTLPAGLVIAATPNIGGTCTGLAGTATAGTGTITVAAVTVPASTASASTCTLTIDITNVSGQTGTCPAVQFTNAAANISGTNNVTNAVTSSCVTVTPPAALVPSLNKAFSPTTIAPGGTTTLTFTLTNPAPNNPAQVVGFTDTLPAGLVIAATPNIGGTCTGLAGTATAGTGTITVAAVTVPASTASASTCTLTIDITNVSGQTGTCPAVQFTNAAANISGTNNVTNAVTSSCVTVTPPAALVPSLNKAFSPTTIAPGGTTTLTFTLTNPAPNNPAQVVGFTDTLPAGLVIAATPNIGGTCTGLTGTSTAGSGTITVATATVPASTASAGTCTLTIDITNVSGQTGTCPAAQFTNAAANISGTTNVTNAVTSACVTVTPPAALVPSLNKALSSGTINDGGTSTLTFTITNPASNNPAQVVNFTDTLPTGLRIAATPNVGGTCTGGTVTAAAGGSSITVTGRTVPASTASASTCTVTVNVTNVAGQLNASCGANPLAFTNGTGNISGLLNLTSAVTASCLTVNGNTFSISKVASTSSLASGNPLSFTITAINNGPSAANGALLTDPLIAGFSATSITCTGATNGAVCPVAGNVTTANLQGAGIALPTFPGGGTVTFVLNGTLTQTSGNIVNTATVSSAPGTPAVSASAGATVSVVTTPPTTTPTNIPTLSEYALMLLALLLAVFGIRGSRARR